MGYGVKVVNPLTRSLIKIALTLIHADHTDIHNHQNIYQVMLLIDVIDQLKMSKQSSVVTCTDCQRPIRKDNIARHKKLYCSGLVAKSVPQLTASTGVIQITDVSVPATASTESVEEYVPLDTTINVGTFKDLFFQEPSEKEVSDAVVCLLRLHYAYDRPQLTAFLARKFPNIPNYLYSTIITAATSAARYVAGKFTVYDAGKDSCDPGLAADAAAAKGALARWSIGLRVLEPPSPTAVSRIVTEQLASSTSLHDVSLSVGSIPAPSAVQTRTVSTSVAESLVSVTTSIPTSASGTIAMSQVLVPLVSSVQEKDSSSVAALAPPN